MLTPIRMVLVDGYLPIKFQRSSFGRFWDSAPQAFIFGKFGTVNMASVLTPVTLHWIQQIATSQEYLPTKLQLSNATGSKVIKGLVGLDWFGRRPLRCAAQRPLQLQWRASCWHASCRSLIGQVFRAPNWSIILRSDWCKANCSIAWSIYSTEAL